MAARSHGGKAMIRAGVSRRVGTALATLAVLAAVLAADPSSVGAGPSDPPTCASGSTSNDCVVRPPGDIPAPAPAKLTNAGSSSRETLTVIAHALQRYGSCPGQTAQKSDMPCTFPAVVTSARLYVPGATSSAHLPDWLVETEPDSCRDGSFSCRVVFSWNPVDVTGPTYVLLSVSTTSAVDDPDINKAFPVDSYDVVVPISDGSTLPPTAAFTINPNHRSPGQYQFVSDSTDPSGSTLVSKWTFGDGESSDAGNVTHTYNKPGTYHVTLKVTNARGISASVTKDVVVVAPTLSAALSFVDANGALLPTVTPRIGDVVRIRLRISASSDGVGVVHGIDFAGRPLTVAPDGLVSVAGPTPPIRPGFTLIRVARRCSPTR